jgi:sRNA-binding regulator protein Hfq
MRLGARLGMEQEQLEEHLGKQIANMTRTDAKDWIKKLREQAAESSPSGKVHFGHWPGSREDEEATYLTAQREASNILRFKLFNGDEFTGTVSEFTPYTITVRSEPGGEETVLRKLAIVYYRQTGEAAARTEVAPRAEQTAESASEPIAEAQSAIPHSHPTEETGVDSDRAGEPAAPERDSMDEDRGV